MLTKCPECELPVSDKAVFCPHCGYPLRGEEPRARQRHKKRMRLPNGFGQISKISGRDLRNPYRAMVTVGTHENGRPICKILKPKGYFATYNEAYAALVEYNRNPYDLDSEVTVDELHERWMKSHYPTLTGDSLKNSYNTAWKRCSSIRKLRVVDVRVKHLRYCIDQAPTPNTKKVTKMVLDMMFDYAVAENITDKNYARMFRLDKSVGREAAENRREHVAFSAENMQQLWDAVNVIPYADAILIQCYMGWRPQELCLLRIEDVNLDDGYVVGGMKTKSGAGRTVPIHDRIRPLVERLYEDAKYHGSHTLITCRDSGDGIMTYAKYRVRFNRVMKRLDIEGHKPHDPRKTFVTMCKDAGVDEYAIKHMVGHAISDITESVYTDRNIEWLRTELSRVE